MDDKADKNFLILDRDPKGDKERYGLDDRGAGNLFADVCGGILKYVSDRKMWFLYNGKIWVPDPMGLKTMELCKKLAEDLLRYSNSIDDEYEKERYKKFAKRWQERRFRETVLKDAASIYPVSLSEFDKDKFLFNCQNGTLNLLTGAFHPHDPKDMLTKISNVTYDPNVRCIRWERHIAEVMIYDQEKVQYLQKAMGYALTGDTRYECLFLLYGPTTRNGKGVTTEVFMTLMGDYGRSAIPETLMNKKMPNSSGPSEDIARLEGARFVNISEPDKQMELSSALIKRLTGNDKITARYLHENSFEYYPQFKCFINTNYLPRVNDATVFTSGRIKVIPFERHFEPWEQDPMLKTELKKPENLSGIFNWCLEGLRLLRATNFAPPAAVIAATEEYQKDSDKIGRFMEELMVPDVNGQILLDEAYRRYMVWCYENGQYAEKKSTFRESLNARSCVRRVRPKGAGRTANPLTYICGFSWV